MGIGSRVVVAGLFALLGASAGQSADHGAGRDTAYYTYARVTQVQPVYRVVEVSTPRTTCWDEPVFSQARDRGRDYRSFTPSVVGGILGGVVGNQFGDGRGQDAMTIAGALLGASIGRDAVHRQRQRQGYERASSGFERRCEVEQVTHEEERMDGYRVFYELHGEEFVTRTSTEPGPEIRVRVQVNPVLEG